MRLNARLHGLGHLLRDRLLTVPPYQRSYSWTAEQVGEFWTDVRGALEAKQPEYFLGTIVLVRRRLPRPSDRDVIVDGQQRLATTSLLLSAVRDAISRAGKGNRAKTVGDMYLRSEVIDRDEPVERLRLNDNDHNFYLSTIAGRPAAPPQRLFPSHTRLKEAAQVLKNAVEELAAKSRGLRRLQQLVDYVDQAVQVIVVEVPQDADAFLIFETLNDRGLDLTIADLLKNFVLGKSGHRMAEVQLAWQTMLGTLEQSADTEAVTQFLRHYWVSCYGITRERDLYRSVRRALKTEQDVVTFALDLTEAARAYSALVNRDHPFWAELGTPAKNAVETLLRLNVKQIRPLLLAAKQTFRKKELARLLRSVVDWSVRGLVVGTMGGGDTESRYAQTAQKIRKARIRTTAEVFSELAAVIPTDAEFRPAFQRLALDGSKRKLNRYLLLTLERHAAGTAQPETVPNENEAQVNLEHVFPLNPIPADWPDFRAEEFEAWALRLGNLVLLAERVNRTQANRPFVTKRAALYRSTLKLTKEVGKKAQWRPEEIDARQKRLADMAVTAWPRKP